MKKLILIVVGLIVFASAKAQNIQWGSSVLEYSSQVKDPNNTAEQALGQPDALFNEDEQRNGSWIPSGELVYEYIVIGLKEPMKIQQVALAESINPTALSQLSVIDENDKEYYLLDFEPKQLPLNARLFRIYFDLTPYKVKALKLIFNNAAVSGSYGIDAVAVSDSKIPISVPVNQDRIMDFFEAERLGEAINSEYKELKPLISPDNTTLYFSRQNHPGNTNGKRDREDIWYSVRDEDGNWKEAVNIGSPLNNKGPNFISSITPDGNTVLLLLGNQYLKKNKMTAGLSVSTKTDSGWTYPVAINIRNGYNLSTKANFFLANNQRAILMAIERDDTYGDRDLYVSFKEDENQWSEPINLGESINSKLEEASPFLAADDRTIFFSSKRLGGFGGYDIYMSKRLDETWQNWSIPENLGASINSAGDDIFFNISIEDNFAYFSRSVNDDLDVYRVKVPKFQTPDFIVRVKGKVMHEWTLEPLSADIKYFNKEDGIEVADIKSGKDGNYQIILPAGKLYEYYVNLNGFIPHNKDLDLINITSNATIERDILLVPIETQQPLTLNNIFFKFATAELREESFPELDRLLNLMRENEEVKIEISGHTCSIGNDEYNQELSEKRAVAIYEYLVRQGINDKRITAIGYGESMPKASNETEAGRMINRRVEFKIMAESVISSSQP